MKRDHVSPTIFSSGFLVMRDQVMGWLRKYLVRFTLSNDVVGTLRKLGRNLDPDVVRDCKVHDQLWLKDAHDRHHARTFSAQHPVDHPRHVPHCRARQVPGNNRPPPSGIVSTPDARLPLTRQAVDICCP